MNMQQQWETYGQLWHGFSSQISQGAGAGDFSPENLPRMCTSVVSRLPHAVAVTLTKAISALEPAPRRHYYYPPSDCHLTLLDVSQVTRPQHRDPLTESTRQAFRAIAGSLAREAPLRLRVKGFGVFPTTVFAQLLDLDDRVTAIRNLIAKIVERETGARLAPPPAPGLVFANVVRFCETPGERVIHFVSGLRDAPEADFEASVFEIVSTDKAMTQAGTIIHDRVSLLGADGGRELAGST